MQNLYLEMDSLIKKVKSLKLDVEMAEILFMKRRIRIISLDKSDQAIKVNKANFKNVSKS